jgi:hypothetical protein
MTMLELIVVAGILSVLIGVGVGFLRRSDGLPETRSMLAGALRAAALDARTRGLPTEVLVVPVDEGGRMEVTARALDPVVLVTFEPGQRQLSAAFEPVLGGDDVPGRCGRARAPSATEKTAALRLPFEPQFADLRDGFAIRCDVLLRERAAGRLLRLGRGIDVQIDEQGRPAARVQAQAGEGAGTAVNLRAPTGLPVGRWCTLELGHDGHRAWLAVDGKELATAALRERLLQQKGDMLEVGPADDALAGAVDELQVFAYAFTPAQVLPEGIEVPALRIAFDAQGEPIVPPEIKLEVVADHRTEVLHVGPGGVLQ